MVNYSSSYSKWFKTLLLVLKNWPRRLFFFFLLLFLDGELLSIRTCRSFFFKMRLNFGSSGFVIIYWTLILVYFIVSATLFPFFLLVWYWSWLVRCNTKKKIRIFFLFFLCFSFPLYCLISLSLDTSSLRFWVYIKIRILTPVFLFWTDN
jgi:hypothetical protein